MGSEFALFQVPHRFALRTAAHVAQMNLFERTTSPLPAYQERNSNRTIRTTQSDPSYKNRQNQHNFPLEKTKVRKGAFRDNLPADNLHTGDGRYLSSHFPRHPHDRRFPLVKSDNLLIKRDPALNNASNQICPKS